MLLRLQFCGASNGSNSLLCFFTSPLAILPNFAPARRSIQTSDTTLIYLLFSLTKWAFNGFFTITDNTWRLCAHVMRHFISGTVNPSNLGTILGHQEFSETLRATDGPQVMGLNPFLDERAPVWFSLYDETSILSRAI